MRPSFDPSAPTPSANITEFNRISGALGAAVAYAMTYAYQNMVSPDSSFRPHRTHSRSIFPSASGFADTLMSAKHLLLRLRLLSQLKSCVGGWEDLC